jgi:hypothetical protein
MIDCSRIVNMASIAALGIPAEIDGGQSVGSAF